jgi:ribA/ribD-fused uncharacterized protein
MIGNTMIDNTQKYYFFWKGPLSQWKVSYFDDSDGVHYCCAEQYMMYKKALLFNDTETAQAIMNTSVPKEHQELGRQVKNFKQGVWDQHARDIVYDGNMLKFTQNPKLLKLLLATEDKILVEASPIDCIWGIGLNEGDAIHTHESEWLGKNWLGDVLTRVKRHFQAIDE